MKVEIEISDMVAEALLRWPIPPEYCGPSLAERLQHVIEGAADSVVRFEETQKTKALYRAFGVKHYLDDDEVPF
jgi:hypothetical protein